MFGPCKVCLEKDKRLADAQAEIAYLRDLSNPAKLTVQIPAIHAEADSILTGNSDPGVDDVESEASRIFAGTY